ncbi:MAG TPA: sugar transferase [Anaerolineae bacterium]|nr:sugar transferase [Anaerolineae bacterium]
MAKRAMDLAISILGLLVLSPLLLVLALWVRLDSEGPVLYGGKRVGEGGRPFHMYKFRTMVMGAEKRGPAVTYRDDPRITSAGRFLRGTKLDELPQLLNVLRGEMSLVGPRPEDPSYVEFYTPEQRLVLSVKPGITGPTQLEYRDEASMLQGAGVDEEYVTRLMPEKLKLDLEYVRTRSLLRDLQVLWRTAMTLLFRGSGVT